MLDRSCKKKCRKTCFIFGDEKWKDIAETNNNEEAGTNEVKEELRKSKEGCEVYAENIKRDIEEEILDFKKKK